MTALVKQLRHALATWQQQRPKTDAARAYRRHGHPLVITSIPKSGTHMLESLVDHLGFAKSGSLIQYYGWDQPVAQSIEHSRAAAVHSIQKLRPGWYLKTHMIAHEAIVSACRQVGARVLFIYRDPRAVVWSHVNHVMRLKQSKFHALYSQQPDDEARIDLTIRGIAASGIVTDLPTHWLPDIRTACSAFLHWLEHPDICLALRYEDLVGGQGQGSDAQQLASTRSILDHLRYPYAADELTGHAASIYRTDTKTFFQGRIDGWREAFTPANEAVFRDVAQDLLVQLGYETEAGR